MPHTPGPWSIYRRDRDALIIGPANIEVALIPGGSAKAGTQLGQANARLIAAAPDLLAACKEALIAQRACDGYTGEGAKSCKSLRAAIAKATGEP